MNIFNAGRPSPEYLEIKQLKQKNAKLMVALIAIRDGKDNPRYIANEAIAKAGGAT